MTDPKHVLTRGHHYPAGMDGNNRRLPKGTTFVWRGEYRRPRKGEWYFGGSIIEAWRAPHDLSTAFHIASMTGPPGEVSGDLLANLSRAWNDYAFARAGLAPGAGMRVVPEQTAYEALRAAVFAMVDAELTEAPEGVSVDDSAPTRVIAHGGVQVNVETDEPTRVVQPCYDDQGQKVGFVDIDEMANQIGRLANQGVTTDGAHHKQWCLEQIAELIGEKLDEHDPGIAP